MKLIIQVNGEGGRSCKTMFFDVLDMQLSDSETVACLCRENPSLVETHCAKQFDIE